MAATGGRRYKKLASSFCQACCVAPWMTRSAQMQPFSVLTRSGLCDTGWARAAGGALPSREVNKTGHRSRLRRCGEESPPSPTSRAFLLRGSFTAAAISHFTGSGRTSLGRFLKNLCPGEGSWGRGGMEVGGAGPWLGGVDVKTVRAERRGPAR